MNTEIKREDFTVHDRILRYFFHDVPRIIKKLLRKTQTAVWISIILTCAGAGLTGCGTWRQEAPAEDLKNVEYVFSYAENQPEDYPTTGAARYFAELVQERSGGRIRINVESGGRLGDEESVISQLAYGGIDFARVSIASVSQDIPDLKILMLPYLYKDEAHMWKVLDGEIGDQFLRRFEGSGMKALGWYDAGARSFYTSGRPIRTPEDMKNLKIRVQGSDIMEELVRALGAEPVQAAYSEVHEMLELQEIDGAENNLASYMAEEHYLQAKYYTLDEHSRIPEVQMISEATWKQLSAEDQQLIAQCAKESAEYERSMWKEYEERALDTVKAAGCQIIRLSEDERKAFEEKTAGIYKTYFSDQEELIRQIQNAQGK